jgi:hypothetical protein
MGVVPSVPSVPARRRLRERRGAFPLRYHLIALVVIALVPTLIFAGIVVGSLSREQRASVENGLQTTVRALATAVERELGASVRALEVLATSTALDRGDLRTFHELARRATQEEEAWYAVTLTDASGQLLVSSLRPFGTRLSSIADRDYFHALIRSGRPAASDLITTGRITGGLNITIAVPVQRDGALRYVLLASISPESLDRLLAAQRILADWIAGIVDSRQVFIARNRNAEGFRGRELMAPSKQSVRGAAAGTGRYPVLDGPDVYTAWQRVASLGWTVTLGAPVSAVDVLFAVPCGVSRWAGSSGSSPAAHSRSRWGGGFPAPWLGWHQPRPSSAGAAPRRARRPSSRKFVPSASRWREPGRRSGSGRPSCNRARPASSGWWIPASSASWSARTI